MTAHKICDQLKNSVKVKQGKKWASQVNVLPRFRQELVLCNGALWGCTQEREAGSPCKPGSSSTAATIHVDEQISRSPYMELLCTAWICGWRLLGAWTSPIPEAKARCVSLHVKSGLSRGEWWPRPAVAPEKAFWSLVCSEGYPGRHGGARVWWHVAALERAVGSAGVSSHPRAGTRPCPGAAAAPCPPHTPLAGTAQQPTQLTRAPVSRHTTSSSPGSRCQKLLNLIFRTLKWSQ